MAIRTIAQLKGWFRKGLFPTESQFGDLIDSFRHRKEKIPMSDVEGLDTQLNGSYSQAEGEALEKSLSKTERELGLLRENIKNEKGAAGGIAPLDDAGKLSENYLPDLANRVCIPVRICHKGFAETEFQNGVPAYQVTIFEDAAKTLYNVFSPEDVAEGTRTIVNVDLEYFRQLQNNKKEYHHIFDGIVAFHKLLDASGEFHAAESDPFVVLAPDGKLYTAYVLIYGANAELETLEEIIVRYTLLDQYWMPVVEQTETTATIQPEVLNRWGEVASLTIDFAPARDGTAAEYCIEFISGETPTTLSLPASVKFPDEPTIEANMRYQISVVNDLGLIAGVEL